MWKAALYGRVSTEHEEQQESIKVQEEALMRYAAENGYNVAGRYFDEGYSGTDFNRPGIQMLKHEIEKENINLVIVKDLSRIGRNNAQTLLFLDYLTRNNVRLIAVNDGYDTLKDEDDIIGIKTWFNERYSRDLSQKIRFAFMHKKKKGEYLGAFPPYGYKKSGEHKNRLEVDYYAAGVVRKIYRLYINGYGFMKIAAMLQKEGIPNPSRYLHYGKKSDRWDWTTVKKILTNPVYTGCLVQHRYCRRNFKDRSIKKVPEDEWIRVENTHDEIISRDVYELVQNILRRRRDGIKYRCGPGSPHLFTSFLYCGQCGSPLYYRVYRGGRGVYKCGNYVKYGRSACTGYGVYEDELKEIVAEALRSEIQRQICLNDMVNDIKKILADKNDDEEDIKQLDRQMAMIRAKEEMLYRDRLDGLIDEHLYMKFFNDLKTLMSSIKARKTETLKAKLSYCDNDLVEKIEGILNIKDGMDRSMLEQFVTRIYIYEGGSIKVYFNFKNK